MFWPISQLLPKYCSFVTHRATGPIHITDKSTATGELMHATNPPAYTHVDVNNLVSRMVMVTAPGAVFV